jgi:ATP/maltotriose-dependent transcriptional regulator MalT
MADALAQLAQVLFFSQSDPATVRVLFEEGLVLYRELGDKDGIASSLCLLGQVALAQGESARARELAEESLALFRDTGDRLGTAESLCFLAHLTAVQGNYAAARALYEQSLLILKEADEQWDIAYNLEGLASVVAAQGDPEWAVRLWGMAKALREAMGAPIPPVYRADYDRSVAAARAQLGEQVFTAAWAQGRVMVPEQALAAQVMPATSLPARSTATSATKPPYPAGLSAREVEVLRLVAQGLTNEQVAEQLVISPRTVNTHLTSIYGKIQVSSRSAATRYAIEHNLV